MRRAVIPLLLWLVPGGAAAQFGQEFQVIPENPRVTVGDTVALSFRARLDERDLLIDTVPRPIGPLPDGVRLLSVEKMHRAPDRVFHGQARLAFYRPGRQPVPLFGLPFMRIVEGTERAILSSDSAYVTVVPVLPAGNPGLKDIREIEPKQRFPWGLLAAGMTLLVALIVAYRRLGRAAPDPVPHEQPGRLSPAPGANPYTTALHHLLSIERERWPDRGELPRHYEAVVNVLRDYLDAAASIPAREQTTGEVLWALPPHLSESGLRDRFRELLEEADLVKFARRRPDAAAARRFLIRSRALLESWHVAGAAEQTIDALR